jgi:YidC/Oxa1 family membrane protein insertase
MREFGQSILGVFSSILGWIHDSVEPLFGVHSWGWAIIGLTLLVRVLLLPLAIKQTRSMKAMQKLQPQIKALQDKYKTDRDMMRKDPEKYKARRQKMNEEMMALYQREGANPAASCLPLLAQAPVFLALFWTLRDEVALRGAPFYFVTGATEGGLEKLVSTAGWPGWLLILLMSGTMFLSQKQMMARNAAVSDNSMMAQQQKILLYAMPVILGVVSFQFPLGILLYWVTTNFWQIVQQAVILRDTSGSAAVAGKGEGQDGAPRAKDGSSGRSDRGAGASSGGRGATSGRAGGRSATSGGASTAKGSVPPGSDAAQDNVEVEKSSSRSGEQGAGNGTSGGSPDGAAPDRSPGSRSRLPKRGGRR